MFARIVGIAFCGFAFALYGCGVECGDGLVEVDGRCMNSTEDAGITDVAGTDTTGLDTAGTDTAGADTLTGDASPADVLGVDRPLIDAGPGCGNGEVEGDEQCDDANDVAGDGCEADCRFTCETAADCDNGDACDGAETCSASLHTCALGTPLECDDSDGCTTDSCNPAIGCVNTLIDDDSDGFAPGACTTPGLSGGDCNDHHADVFPAQGAYFTVPACPAGGSSCPLSDQSFDYNCDLAETLRWPGGGRCDEFVCRGPIWDCDGIGCEPMVPPCGESGGLIDCIDIAGRCAAGLSGPVTTQECQ